MEFYLPSLFLIILALFFIFYFVPSMTPYAMVLFAIVMLVLATYNHWSLFSDEYRIQTWADTAKSFAPYIMIGLVVLMSGGYILFLVSRGRGTTLPSPGATPPPETATNMITEAMNNAIQGVANIGANTPSKALISANPSLKQNAPSGNIRRAAESRLAQQV